MRSSIFVTRICIRFSWSLREILLISQSDAVDGGVGLEESILLAESIKYAVIIVSSLPVLLMYPFVRRHFVKGVMIGSIKG